MESTTVHYHIKAPTFFILYIPLEVYVCLINFVIPVQVAADINFKK